MELFSKQVLSLGLRFCPAAPFLLLPPCSVKYTCRFFVFKGSNLLSVGEEGVLVRWQWKTHEQQFLPRLGAPIHHVAVSPDDSLTAISQKDNSECFITIAFTFVYICQLWLDMSPFQKIDYI